MVPCYANYCSHNPSIVSNARWQFVGTQRITFEKSPLKNWTACAVWIVCIHHTTVFFPVVQRNLPDTLQMLYCSQVSASSKIDIEEGQVQVLHIWHIHELDNSYFQSSAPQNCQLPLRWFGIWCTVTAESKRHVHPVTFFSESLEVTISTIPESNCVDFHDSNGQRLNYQLPSSKGQQLVPLRIVLAFPPCLHLPALGPA